MNFDSIWSCEGQINTGVFPTSHPGCVLYSSVFRTGTLSNNKKKIFHSMTLPAIGPKDKRWCVGKRLSVPPGLLVLFARFLHAFSVVILLVLEQNYLLLL